ncbi:response regulator [Halomicroarcula sp. GCM10025709]|uniref:response regulator n=1 Tax=Haloarcula TaxID=2237 RepID=UPI0024C35C54|nr:response regulator [Halomicroarcula sp. YJ-61-S]
MAATGDENSADGQTPTVLIIDDEPDIRNLYTLHLRPDYTVKTAANGDVAPEMVAETVDLVFCDRRMPQVSGDEFLQRLRDHGVDVPVVYISAIDVPDESDQDNQGYLEKPITGETLRETAERYIKQGDAVAAD